MAYFIKIESFTEEAKKLTPEERQKYIKAHVKWVKQLNTSGIEVKSGFLVDDQKKPGGGGLMLIKAKSFETAKSIVQKDPIILAGIVKWKLNEWIPVHGELI